MKIDTCNAKPFSVLHPLNKRVSILFLLLEIWKIDTSYSSRWYTNVIVKNEKKSMHDFIKKLINIYIKNTFPRKIYFT